MNCPDHDANSYEVCLECQPGLIPRVQELLDLYFEQCVGLVQAVRS